MLFRELTRSQKKKVRELIEKALIKDYSDGVKRIRDICDTYVDGQSDPKEFYHKLFSAMATKDEQIARRYNDLTGSKYLLYLINLLREGVLTNEDIRELDDELKQTISLINKKA